MRPLIFSLLIFLGLGQNLLATEHKLVQITNDEDKEICVFVVKTEGRDNDIKSFFKEVYDEKGVRIIRENLSVKDVLKNTGLVLKEIEGRVIVSLKSENFAEHNGGHITLDTLYNGISGSRKEYEYEVARTSRSWELLKDGAPVKAIHLKSKKVFPVGTVGIADIVHKQAK